MKIIKFATFAFAALALTASHGVHALAKRGPLNSANKALANKTLTPIEKRPNESLFQKSPSEGIADSLKALEEAVSWRDLSENHRRGLSSVVNLLKRHLDAKDPMDKWEHLGYAMGALYVLNLKNSEDVKKPLKVALVNLMEALRNAWTGQFPVVAQEASVALTKSEYLAKLAEPFEDFKRALGAKIQSMSLYHLSFASFVPRFLIKASRGNTVDNLRSAKMALSVLNISTLEEPAKKLRNAIESAINAKQGEEAREKKKEEIERGIEKRMREVRTNKKIKMK